MIELTPQHLLLALVINRIVETIKVSLPAEDPEAPQRWRTPLVLFLSFFLASVVMVTVFPTYNLFPEASTAIAGLVYTGILIGGVANGWDFLGTIARAAQQRLEGAAGIVIEAVEGPEISTYKVTQNITPAWRGDAEEIAKAAAASPDKGL